ncbi:hypothetical protein D3C78_1681250 [compost metagenome]
MLRINLFDNLVQLYPFVLPEYLIQRKVNAIVGKHVHIGFAAQHFAVHQRAVAIKQNTVNLVHQGPCPSVMR